MLTPKKRISLLVAMASNRTIGMKNALPWHLPADLKRFKALTIGHHIVMGRKTFDSIGKPLPGRVSVVITRNPEFLSPGVIVVNSLDAAIAACGDDDEIFIIGGAEIYGQAINIAERIYLTEIDADIAGDAHFAEFDKAEWQETERVSHAPDEKNSYPYHFVIFDRKIYLNSELF